MNEISGYELAQEIISKRDEDAVATILRYAGDAECDYLELKASVLARQQDLGPGEQPEDMYWNIAKELIALMNTRGGLLVIGVTDGKNHDAVPLRENDKDNIIDNEGIEAYIRKVIEANVVPQNQEWTYKNRKYCVPPSKNLWNHLQVQKLNYLGETVVAFLVEPCDEKDFITVKSHWSDGREAPEILPRRRKGHIGECELLSDVTDIFNHIQTRRTKDPILGARLAELLSTQKGFKLDTLPERNEEFCGREKEMEKIRKLLTAGKIPILHGEPGTGKTELACEFAHRYKGRYPGGCLFLNMENVHSWPTTLNMIYANPRVRQALGHIPSQNEKDRTSWLFNRLISNLDRGNILVILDNMDDETALTYNELKKGYLAEYLSGPRRVCIIGTTRVVKTNFGSRSKELAEVVELENLEPEAAFNLIKKRMPPRTAEEEDSLRKIVKELGHHAWSTEISGSFLSKNYDKLPPPPLESYLKILIEDKSNIKDNSQTLRENGMSVKDLLRPTIKQLEEKEGDIGKHAITLAKCIAFFPNTGVSETPLRFIWRNLFKYPERTSDGLLDEFNSSRSLLRQYALIGSDTTSRRIRMHHLTQSFFRTLDGGKAARHLAEKLSKTIASDPHCPPHFWAEIAKDNILMSHCPWKALDGSASHDIVSANPEEFASKIDWRKLDGYDIADLLISHPELSKRVRSFEVLYHDDSESPCKAFAMLLASRPDPFAAKCDFSRFSPRDVVHLLAHQPQLANHCKPALTNFNRKDWSRLLSQQPNLLDDNNSIGNICKWDQFKKDDWMRLLAAKPNLATDPRFTSTHSLADFSTFKWAYLLSSNPRHFMNHPDCPRDKIAESSRATILILSRQPWLADRTGSENPPLNFNFKNLSPLQWAQLLSIQPDLSKFCDKVGGWAHFTGRDWSLLLEKQPQFAGRCNFSKLDGNDWGQLLVFQPQLATPDAWKCMASQPHSEFLSPLVRVIYNHPELAESQQRDLSSISSSGKRMLLSRIPALANQIDIHAFPPREWARLVVSAPNFAEDCPFDKLNPVELAVILNDQPHLEDTIKKKVPYEQWQLAQKIHEEKTRALRLSDFLWHFDDARMSCNLKKLIVYSANLSWTYFILGMFRQSKFYLGFLAKCLKRTTLTTLAGEAMPVRRPTSVIPSLSTMLDMRKKQSNHFETGDDLSNVDIFVHRFKKAKAAAINLACFKKSLRAHKLSPAIHDIANFSSQKTKDKISELKKKRHEIVCLNFEERMPFSFHDKKKQESVSLFHDESRYFDNSRQENLEFDLVVTISPMIFGGIPKDVGERILQAIVNRPSKHELSQ